MPISTSSWDIGDIDLHISGCINSCGHHHSGHIGILGVDKDGSRVVPAHARRLRRLHPQRRPSPGKVIGPSFAADEVADAVEAVSTPTVRSVAANERFIDTVRRIGIDPSRPRPMPCAAARPDSRPAARAD
jgi:sulfite reductase (NADPH) hemoprotein beta-component